MTERAILPLSASVLNPSLTVATNSLLPRLSALHDAAEAGDLALLASLLTKKEAPTAGGGGEDEDGDFDPVRRKSRAGCAGRRNLLDLALILPSASCRPAPAPVPTTNP